MPLTEAIMELDEYIDDRLSKGQSNFLGTLYTPFKLFLAKSFLNEEDYDMDFLEEGSKDLEGLKALIDDPNLQRIKDTSIALFAKDNGKVTPKNIEDKDYLKAITKKSINTYKINELKYAVEEEMPEPEIQPMEEEKKPEPIVKEEEQVKMLDDGLENPEEEPLIADLKEEEDIKDVEEEEEIEEKNEEIKPVIEEPIEPSPMKTESEVKELEQKIGENKLGERPAENLVNVVAGAEYIPEQIMDVLRTQKDVIKVLKETKVVMEGDDEVEQVIIRIVRAKSPCYAYSMKEMMQE